jgi:hypothetical protein
MMRRILLLLTVAMVMAAMMAFGAGAASAQPVVFVDEICSHPNANKIFGSYIITPAATPNPIRCVGPSL